MATSRIPGKARRASTKPAAPGRAGTKAAQTAKAPPRPVVVVNEAMRRRYQVLLKDFRDAHGAELVRWDAAYEALDSMLRGDAPLYLAGGFKSARAFLASVLPGVALSTVRDGVRVARHFNADDEKRYGVRKLALLLDYLEAESGAELPRVRIDPATTKVDVADGRTAFASLTFDEMRDVARRKRGAKARSGTDTPAVLALRATFGGGGLGNVAVQCRGGRWSLGRIEERQFADLGEALIGHARRLKKAKPG